MCNEHNNIKFGEGKGGRGERFSRNIKKMEFHISLVREERSFVLCKADRIQT